MPSIQQAIARNKNRISLGGETGTGVGPIQDMLTPAPTPPQDLPVGNGLPQRGMFAADLVLASDRSDSSRAFRGQGTRSATFPYPPASTTTQQKTIVQTTTPIPAPASSLLLETNGIKNPNQQIADFIAGGGIEITSDPTGGITFVGLSSASTYDVVFAILNVPPANYLVEVIRFARDEFFPANFAGSQGFCAINPTATALYQIYQNGTLIGSASISTSGVFTYSSVGGIGYTFAIGDVLQIRTPVVQDVTLSDVTMTLLGSIE